MKIRRLFQLLAVSILTAACIRELPQPDNGMNPSPSPENHSGNGTGMVKLPFVLSRPMEQAVVKSALAPDENNIRNLQVIIYKEGKLYDYKNITDPLGSPGPIDFLLPLGASYGFYALGNFPEADVPLDEKEFRKACIFRISRLDEISAALPMVWSETGYKLDTPLASPIEILLERLVSRIDFSFDCHHIPGFTVNSVRLCQSAALVHPFAVPEGSHAGTPEEVIGGDYACAEDIEILNTGGTVTFYTLENCQGILLSGNKDPWKKVPSSLSGQEETATYLELTGTFSAPSVHVGTATYRLFLGQNNLDDFNIRRNTVMKVSLIGTDNHFGSLSWKVDARTHIDPNTTTSWISSDSMHRSGDFYLGETFRTCFNISPGLEAYLGNPVSETHLEFIPDKGQGAIRFENIVHGNEWSCLGSCRETGNGSIWLVRNDGETVVELLSGISISYPVPAFTWNDAPVCRINTAPLRLDAHMTDKAGNRLDSNPLGFDSSFFSFQLEHQLPGDMNLQVSRPEKTSCFDFTCTNDGKNRPLNTRLAASISDGTSYKLILKEKCTGRSMETSFRIGMERILITSDPRASGNILTVQNSSRIPLDINIYNILPAITLEDPNLRTAIVDEVNQKFKMDSFSYISTSFPNVDSPFYGHGLHFFSGWEQTCIVPWSQSGHEISYNLSTLSHEDIRKGCRYKYHDAYYLFQLIDVKLLDRILTNEQMEFTLKNPYDGWTSGGTRLYSGGLLLKNKAFMLDGHPFITPEIMEGLREKKYGVPDLHFYFDSTDNTFRMKNLDPGTQHLKADFECKGILTGGATVVSKKGGKKEYKTCTQPIEGRGGWITLDSKGRMVDGGALNRACNTMYSTPFPNYVWGKNKPKHPRPKLMEFELKIMISDDNGNMYAYPVKIVREKGEMLFYHAQDNTYYHVTDKITIPLHEYINVTRMVK